jgi:hypothetical protein
MRRLAQTAVQLEEAKRFVLAGDVPHLRLALILLDNAVEVVMQRAVGDELEHAWFYSRLLERLPLGPLDADGERMRSEFQAHVVPDKRAQKVRRFFGEKLTFLATERDRIPRPIARVLRHIHDYRNEAQHQDRVRVGSLRSATLILFDIATELLVTLKPGSTTWHSEDDYGWLERFGLSGSILAGGQEVVTRVRDHLRSGLALDIEPLHTALVEHLTDRLNEMEEQLAFVVENSTLGPGNPSVVLKAIQFRDSGEGRMLTERGPDFAAFAPRHSEKSFNRWRSETARLGPVNDRFELFNRFATIEDEFEPLEASIRKTARELDSAIQLAVDIARGK